jgi:hypothetical protein
MGTADMPSRQSVPGGISALSLLCAAGYSAALYQDASSLVLICISDPLRKVTQLGQ